MQLFVTIMLMASYHLSIATERCNHIWPYATVANKDSPRLNSHIRRYVHYMAKNSLGAIKKGVSK